MFDGNVDVLVQFGTPSIKPPSLADFIVRKSFLVILDVVDAVRIFEYKIIGVGRVLLRNLDL
jgi:hypothetical protein